MDGFIGPGHVATVIGAKPIEFVAAGVSASRSSSRVSSRWTSCKSTHRARAARRRRGAVENEYAASCPGRRIRRRCAPWTRCSKCAMQFEWRGLGMMPKSALQTARELRRVGCRAALCRARGRASTDPDGAQCGEVLRACSSRPQCPLFGTVCTPEQPIGALMVSSEGACAAHYQYAREPVLSGA